MAGNLAEKLEDGIAPTELDPRAVREKAGLDRASMADLMGMSEFGYNAWETGTRRPGGPAYQLLRLIDKDPKTILGFLRR